MAGSLAVSPGVNITPSSVRATLPTNYITNFDFLNQYMPEVYDQEFARYGNRSIASFLRGVSAELPFSSDLIRWSEEGRLHTKYEGLTPSAYSAGTQRFTVASGKCVFRVNQTVFLASETLGTSKRAIITAVNNSGTGYFDVAYYDNTGATNPFASGTVTAFVYGSEFSKGTDGMDGSLEAAPEFFDAKPVIIKDAYTVAGSDMAQIGWVEVVENGKKSYLWYLKSEGETRRRFEDYLEMMMVEHQEAEASSAALAYLSPATSTTPGGTSYASTAAGSQGLFDAIETRGNVWSGGTPSNLSDWDTIVSRLDKQGAIAENVIFNDREFGFEIDNMLGAVNAAFAGGASYGMFENDKEMALNLGFTGFRRGYDFYKTDWKYLNDATLRGGITGGAVNGVLIPAGSKNVYDQVLGENATRPFLHVRYRKSEAEDRKYKSWVTGGAGGASNSRADKMTVDFLSERTLCVLGANNFMIFED